MADANLHPTPRYSSDPDPNQTEGQPSRLNLSPVKLDLPAHERPVEVLRLAQEAFAKTDSWVVFFREMLGVDGVVRKLFSEPDEMQEFEQTDAFAELQEMVAAIRSQDNSKGDVVEPERMITIRLPKSLHDVLKSEADEASLSINKLCISKLLQRIDGRFVPIQQGRRRGRRPGPQGPRSKRVPETGDASLETARVPGSGDQIARDRLSGDLPSPPQAGSEPTQSASGAFAARPHGNGSPTYR